MAVVVGRLFTVVLVTLLLTPCGAARAADGDGARPFRILHVMSYHSPWRWTDGQLEGFRQSLAGVPVEYQVVQLDAKRNATPEQTEQLARRARELIESWKPDLLYTSDDDAQHHVARHYVNTALPVVFSGVNQDPHTYGFIGSTNVTGVLEQEHVLESMQLLRHLAPKARRIAVVFDEAPMWQPVERRMREQVKLLPHLEFGPWDRVRSFEEYQRKITEYQQTVDAVAIIGIFNLRDRAGNHVPHREVLRWTAEHSRLPDVSFWFDRVEYGTLCAFTISEHEQGAAAGAMARAILLEGKRPAEIPVQATARGLPVVSLARARKLGIMPSTSVLLSARVLQRFDWEQP